MVSWAGVLEVLEVLEEVEVGMEVGMEVVRLVKRDDPSSWSVRAGRSVVT